MSLLTASLLLRCWKFHFQLANRHLVALRSLVRYYVNDARSLKPFRKIHRERESERKRRCNRIERRMASGKRRCTKKKQRKEKILYSIITFSIWFLCNFIFYIEIVQSLNAELFSVFKILVRGYGTRKKDYKNNDNKAKLFIENERFDINAHWNSLGKCIAKLRGKCI